MSDQENDHDDFGIRGPFRLADYPSTLWVLLGALGSGFAWVMYKRRIASKRACEPAKGSGVATGSVGAPVEEERD